MSNIVKHYGIVQLIYHGCFQLVARWINQLKNVLALGEEKQKDIQIHLMEAEMCLNHQSAHGCVLHIKYGGIKAAEGGFPGCGEFI